MDEYISREEACKDSLTVQTREYGSIEVVPVDYLQSLEAADVQPVKYGRWEINGDRYYEFYPFCSNCKYKPPKELIRCNALSLEPTLTKYCPNCGSENGTRIYRGGDNN